MSTGQQIADARLAAGKNQLYAAKLPAAYAATWKQVYLRATAPELLDGVIDDSVSDFSISINGVSFTVEALGSPNGFVVGSTTIVFIRHGDGVRVRVAVEFTPDPLVSGDMLVELVGSNQGVVASDTISATGMVDFTWTNPVDDPSETFQIRVTGGSGTGGADWAIGAIAVVTVSLTPFPPAFQPVEFALNPAIPFHRVVLAIPTNEFNCVVRATFTNGGTIQGAPLELALGQQEGSQFYLNPPSAPFQARLSLEGTSGPLLLSNQTIYDASATLQSNRVAVFEWSAIADKVTFEVVRCSVGGNSEEGGVAIGLLQMPQ